MEYKASDIRDLSAIEGIQLNPNNYIGSTKNPNHLIEEVFDNSLDEAQIFASGLSDNKLAIVCVTLDTKSNIYSVLDNGRGIPIDEDVPIRISSKLHSGSKFEDLKKAYKITSGRHGIGLTAVNALSEWYEIEIYRDNKHAIFRFENAKLKSKKIDKFTGEKPFSTKISFKPSKKFFESIDVDINKIRNRLYTASVELENCGFALIIDGKKEVIKINKHDFFKNHVLQKDDKDISPIIELNSKVKYEKFNAVFCYSFSGSIGQKIKSSVNILAAEDGGTHLNFFNSVLKDFFMSKLKKFNITRVKENDCLVGLRAFLSLSLENATFGGQTKDKVENRANYFNRFSKDLKRELEEYFQTNKDLLKFLLEHFEKYRKNQDSKKLNRGLNSGKRAFTKFTKLRDCISKNGELFIVEGDSAGGSFVEARNPNLHAVFPLKGKIPSIATKKGDIIKNKEIKELLQALGCGYGPSFDISKLRYEKVICSTDADPDGNHIFCLLTIALMNLVPEIIRQGRYYLIRTPLYAINKGKTFLPLWTEQEVEKAQKENQPITRFKGLGELSPWQLKICALDENTRRLIKLPFPNNEKDIMKLFSDVEERRKLLECDIKDMETELSNFEG